MNAEDSGLMTFEISSLSEAKHNLLLIRFLNCLEQYHNIYSIKTHDKVFEKQEMQEMTYSSQPSLCLCIILNSIMSLGRKQTINSNYCLLSTTPASS